MTISDEGHIVYEGIKYQTLDIKVADTLPLADYPKEKYLEDYDSTLADYLNEGLSDLENMKKKREDS